MHAEISRLDLRLRRRSVWGYAVGFGAYAVLIVALYPSFRSDRSLDQLAGGNPTMAALFGVSGSLTSPAGWMNANLYANVVPLFALVLTIGYGASSVAGQNEDERLGLLAALPVSRTAMLLQKLLTLLVLSTPVALVTAAAALLGRRYDLDLGLGALLGVTVGVVLLAFDFGALALAVGCLTGSRGVALGITSAAAAAAYVISSLAGVVDCGAPPPPPVADLLVGGAEPGRGRPCRGSLPHRACPHRPRPRRRGTVGLPPAGPALMYRTAPDGRLERAPAGHRGAPQPKANACLRCWTAEARAV